MGEFPVVFAFLFRDCFANPEGEFGEGGGVREEGDVGPVFDDAHAEGAEMFNLFLLDYAGAGAEDGAVEMEGGREGGF